MLICISGTRVCRAETKCELLSGEAGDDINGALLFGDDRGENSGAVVKIYAHLRVFAPRTFIKLFKNRGIGAYAVPLMEYTENLERNSVLLGYDGAGADELFAFALRSYTDKNTVFAFHLADVLS